MANQLNKELNQLQMVQYIAPIASLFLVWLCIIILKRTNSFETAMGVAFLVDFILLAIQIIIIGNKESLKMYLKELEGNDKESTIFWGKTYYAFKHISFINLFTKQVAISNIQKVYNDIEIYKTDKLSKYDNA